MAYRNDNGLAFLSQISSKDLGDLVYCLSYTQDNDIRCTEDGTRSDKYKKYYSDHQKYWQSVAADIQCFGVSSFATILRGGKGVEYKEVLMNVCEQININYNKDSIVEKIEKNLLMKIISVTLESMSPEKLSELAEAIGEVIPTDTRTEVMVGIFRGVFRAGGLKSYQLTLMIVNAVLKALTGRGLTFVVNVELSSKMSLLSGPSGWVIPSLWNDIDEAGDAYRVSIPSVIHVAILRQKYLCEMQSTVHT